GPRGEEGPVSGLALSLSDRTSGIAVADDRGRRPSWQRRLRPAQVPGDELAQDARPLPVAHQLAELHPVVLRDADGAGRRVGLLRCCHARSLPRVHTRSLDGTLPCTYTGDRIVYVHGSVQLPLTHSSVRPHNDLSSTPEGTSCMAVSKRLRFEIFRRDSHTCRYCGATAPGTPLRVDHVVPLAPGGTDHPSNLVTSCEPCNSGKTSTLDGQVAEADDTRIRPRLTAERADELVNLWATAYQTHKADD